MGRREVRREKDRTSGSAPRSRHILIGLCAGAGVGVLLGELVSPLAIVAQAFVRLLQMTVLPYVTVSIILSLGRLDLATARGWGLKSGLVILALWGVALLFALLIPLTFPAAESAWFFSSSLVEQAPPFDFVDLYIPSNPFHSLANGVVPAVVLFSVIVGIALIGIERKAVLLDVLTVASATIGRATQFVVRLTPIGLFALAASAAGTLRLEQLQRIEIYLLAYGAICLVVGFWVLPGLVAAVTPISHRDILSRTRSALLTAFSAGDLFIVLPILIDACKELLTEHGVTERQSASLPDVIVPASFNFPHTGKLLSLSFIAFAGWFTGTAIAPAEYPRLAVTGVLSFFGSLNAAVPFLLDAFRIPADAFQLFVATGVVNSHFGALVAAVHTVAVALLGSAAIAHTLEFNPTRLARYAVITAALTATIVGGLRLLFETTLRPEFKGAEMVYGMSYALVSAPAEIVEDAAGERAGNGVLDAIFERGVLRVAFGDERPPFVFRNARQELVGFDVEIAHLLARDLGVRARFVEMPQADLVQSVALGAADIGIGGHAVTPLAATDVRFSQPYLDETAAFVVKDHLRGSFETWAAIDSIRDVAIGVLDVPYYVRLLQDRLPTVTLTRVPIDANPLDDGLGLDAVALPAERGSILTLLNPQWTVVVPSPGVIRIPLAFPLTGQDPRWNTFVDTWIELKRRDGTLNTLYDHWILGRSASVRRPRWSVVRNVLHWVD